MFGGAATARRDHLGTSDLGSPRSEVRNAKERIHKGVRIPLTFFSLSLFIRPGPILPL
jgi:hypothetical protein